MSCGRAIRLRFCYDRPPSHHSGIAQPERRNGLTQRTRLLSQCMRGGGGLLHERRILLRDLVHLRDGHVHLLDAFRLLAGSRRDFADDAGNTMHRLDDVIDDLVIRCIPSSVGSHTVFSFASGARHGSRSTFRDHCCRMAGHTCSACTPQINLRLRASAPELADAQKIRINAI